MPLSKYIDFMEVTPHTANADDPLPDPVHGVGGSDAINGLVLKGTPIRLGLCIGTGTFGEIRVGRNAKTMESVAVKLEQGDIKDSQLQHEWQIYQILNKSPAVGIPKAYHFGHCGTYRALAMELLGPSIEQIFRMCGSKFSIHVIMMLAMRTINLLEYLHEHHIIHRDINPTNFVVPRPPDHDKTIYMIDFGLSKYYRDPDTNIHIRYAEYDVRVGTPCFMSVRAHMGIEQSRRDDLESLGYVLIYLLRGNLPWEHLPHLNDDAHNKSVFNMKTTLRIEELCEGHPVEFVKYMQYVRKLEFQRAPDYVYLRHMFQLRLEIEGINTEGKMDWCKGRSRASIISMKDRTPNSSR